MDADRPDLLNGFKFVDHRRQPKCETIGGDTVNSKPSSCDNRFDHKTIVATGNGNTVQTVAAIHNAQSVEKQSDTVLSNVVLSDINEASGRQECGDNGDIGDDRTGIAIGVNNNIDGKLKSETATTAATTGDEVAVEALPGTTAAPATVSVDNRVSSIRSASDGINNSIACEPQSIINHSDHSELVHISPIHDHGEVLESKNQLNCDSNTSVPQNDSVRMYQRIRSTSDDEDGEDQDYKQTNGYGYSRVRHSPTLSKKKKRSRNGALNGAKRNGVAPDDNSNENGDDARAQRALYNEYVNLLCDTDLSGATATGSMKKRTQNGLNNVTNAAGSENKPLLLDLGPLPVTQMSKPKSIVKSPSTQTFGSNEKYFDGNRKPRLSIQCTGSDPERPVLHVQFLAHQSQDEISQSLPSQPYAMGRQDNAYNSDDIAKKDSIDYSVGPESSISSTDSSDESSSSSDDEDSSIGFAEAKPPDGGWGWVVVFASFMVNLIADGITFSFGVIYVEFLNYFNEGKAKTAWIGSLFMAMPLLSGPIASFLTDRYGCRRVTIVGSILSSLGFFISAFANTMEMLFFTFGILAGFGLSLCYVAAVVIVAYYFDKRRSFATGLSVCGSGIGTFIFAPLTQILIDEYGWRGTTLILSGLFLNMCICGMLMRDLEWTTYKSKQKAKLRRKRHRLGISAESFSVSNSTNTAGTTSNTQNNHDSNGGDGDENGESSLTNRSDEIRPDPRLFSSLITLPTFVKNGEKVPMEVLELLSSNKNIHNVLLQNYPGLAHSRSFSQPLATSRHSNSGGNLNLANAERLKEREHSKPMRDDPAFLQWLKEENNPRRPKGVQLMLNNNRNPASSAYLKDLRMHRHSLTYRGAMLNINRYRLRASSCPDIYRNSMTTIAKEKTQWSQGMAEFKSVLLDMLDFSFFSDPRFLLFSISNFFLYTWYDVPYVYLADNAIEMGFTESDASILISAIGIVNMFGEIILGWCGDRKFISAGMIYAICMLFCGLVTGLVPLLTSYSALSAVSGLFGLFIAANYALTSIILVELITLDRFTNAYGLLLLVQGVANLVGPPLAGWITDLTGNYNLAFYLSGIFIAVSGVLMIILPAHSKYKKYCELRRKSSAEARSYSDAPQTDCESNKAAHNTIPASKSALKANGNTNNCFGLLTNDVTGKIDGRNANHV